MGVDGVILAAGFSSRLGTNKMILDIYGKTIIERVVDSMYDVCSSIFVVGGYNIDSIINVLNKYPKVNVVFNENYIDGMFSSVKEGLKYVRENRFFLIPGDYPAISKSLYESMLFEKGDIIIPTYKGKRGHPVLMKSDLIKEVVDTQIYLNMKEFINTKSYITKEVLEEGILMDVDTIEDYEAVLSYYSIRNLVHEI